QYTTQMPIISAFQQQQFPATTTNITKLSLLSPQPKLPANLHYQQQQQQHHHHHSQSAWQPQSQMSFSSCCSSGHASSLSLSDHHAYLCTKRCSLNASSLASDVGAANSINNNTSDTAYSLDVPTQEAFRPTSFSTPTILHDSINL